MNSIRKTWTRRVRWFSSLAFAGTLVVGAAAQREPRIGYVFPAGGRRSASFEVLVGGQYLDGVAKGHVSGDGIEATVLGHEKPLPQQQINKIRDKLRELQGQLQSAQRQGRAADALNRLTVLAGEQGLTLEDLKRFAEFRQKQSDPKRQLNPQIGEMVTLRIDVAPDAATGERELRLQTPAGLSNPIRFCVGQLPEYREPPPAQEFTWQFLAGLRFGQAQIGEQDSAATEIALPGVVNGQILPGQADRFRFQARRGQKLVAATSARALIPYLADAVPGWFQATLALFDGSGHEVAYADDFRFDPDPVLFYEIPEDGEYTIEIRDALYRGREDFVYRIALGELPYVTGVFPLGGPAGGEPTVALSGWNLPVDRLTLDATDWEPGIRRVRRQADERLWNGFAFALDDLPECLEEEPNDCLDTARMVRLPTIVNGRIGAPGDADLFRFEGKSGESIVLEVVARRLNSPLDSVLTLTDSSGRPVAFNDDATDSGFGLQTHSADSQIVCTLPADGSYFVRLADAQNYGGDDFAYRLRLGPPRPDFELRVVPSSLNARTGSAVPFTVRALCKDSFSGDITLSLRNAPEGFEVNGWLPAGHDRARVTLTVPAGAGGEPIPLHIEGEAMVGGESIRRPAVPAEDQMQAFFYQHIVASEELLVLVNGPRRSGGALRIFAELPLRIPIEGTARIRVRAPVGPRLDQAILEPSEPSDGIVIREVSANRGDIEIVLAAEGGTAKAGRKGNLILEAFVEREVRTRLGTGTAAKRRVQIGVLPAVPFVIVE